MEKTLGIIGYGIQGSWHAESVNATVSGLKAVAVYDIDPEKRAKAEADGLTAYASAEALLASGIDVVVIAVPNHYHAHYAKLAMRAGVAVVCEKPACLTPEELEDVLAVSRETGVFFTVHQNRRFDIDYATVHNLIQHNTIGNLRLLESRLYNNRGCSTAWRSCAAVGGGALYDWGVHMIDQVLCLVPSKPVLVQAHLQHMVYTEVDDGFEVTITFENGARAHVIVDFWHYIDEPRWLIQGDDGSARIDEWFGREGKVVKANLHDMVVEEGNILAPNTPAHYRWPRPKMDIQELPLPLPATEPRWEEFYENVLAVLNGTADPLITHDQVRLSLKVIMAAFESDKTDQTIVLA